MDQLRRIAKAHYHQGTDRAKNLAHEFFDAMDEDGDGVVDFEEFMDFMKEEGYEDYMDEELFDKLDRGQNDNLDFWEVMTLYYIIKSGRPFCFECDKFLVDVYFACVECFESRRGPYYICLNCYKDSNYDHGHHGRRARFLDNFTMLEAQRVAALNQPRGPPQRSQSANNAMVPYSSSARNPSRSSSSRANVPRSGSQRRDYNSPLKVAFKAFDVALNIGNLAAGVGACSIM